MSRFSNILSLLSIIHALAGPVEAHPLAGGHGFVLPLKRSSILHHAPFIFNETLVKRDLLQVVLKYKNALQYLAVGSGAELSQSPSVADIEGVFDVDDPNLGQAPIRPILETSRSAKLPLTDYRSEALDILYYGQLDIGTPSQQLTVDIDTGSADLWLPSDCPECSNKQFKKKASKTYSDKGKPFQISYGTGSVSGVQAMDVVSFQGLTVKNQTFGAVSTVSQDFDDYPNDGLIGLAFSSIATSGQPTFFQNLIDSNLVATPAFSIHLTRGKESGSEVCFGCYDTSKATGSASYVPVTSKTYWTVALDGMSVNTQKVAASGLSAAIDTGTTLIYVPNALAKKFYSMIPGSREATEYGTGFYAYSCKAAFTPSMIFGGKQYSIDLADFNIGRLSVNSTECIGGVIAVGNGFPANFAIVGAEFLKSWYSTFDQSDKARVGFSPSINNKS